MTSHPFSISRRALLHTAAALPLSLWFGKNSLAEARETDAGSGRKVLVCVCLRGGVDGLSVVVPYSDPDYYRARPSIAIARPGRPDAAIDLDGRFGLHPRLAPLLPAYRAGELSLVHAVGSPHPTRSHFEAQDYLETGMPGARAVNDGWVARCLAQSGALDEGELRAVALGGRAAPLALRGYEPAVCAKTLNQLKLTAPEALRAQLNHGFEELYAARADALSQAGTRALAIARRLNSVRKMRRDSGRDQLYPGGARAFADVAALIRGRVGLQAAWIDVSGWDTHRGQGDAQNGELSRQLERLGSALACFREDLGSDLENVSVLAMSEFGRTVRENGTGGTDHGHATVMLLMGGAVKGGKVYGRFPGLREEQRHEGRDLALTTDFRDVLAEVIDAEFGIQNASSIFAGYTFEAHKRLRLFR